MHQCVLICCLYYRESDLFHFHTCSWPPSLLVELKLPSCNTWKTISLLRNPTLSTDPRIQMKKQPYKISRKEGRWLSSQFLLIVLGNPLCSWKPFLLLFLTCGLKSCPWDPGICWAQLPFIPVSSFISFSFPPIQKHPQPGKVFL